MANDFYTSLSADDLILDDLPDHVTATLQVRNDLIAKLGKSGGGGREFVIDDVRRWLPGQVVRVAFLDGNKDLHGDVVEAAQVITDACNLFLDFGKDNGGNFRRWRETDTQYTAEIRVSFDKTGYFSLVGTDSIDCFIGGQNERSGGRPHQASLNLGGFAIRKPATWRGTVRHEFLHALGFHHAHQNMRGPCEAEFRWEDDENYEPTRDARGAFVADSSGRRPGIYTYLSGYPNFWARPKVDHNLRTAEDPDLVAGPFDRRSVMLYRFAAFFYKKTDSPCAPAGEGQELSDGDKRGLKLLYPHTRDEVAAIVGAQERILDVLAPAIPERPRGQESERDGAAQDIRHGAAAVVRSKLAALRR